MRHFVMRSEKNRDFSYLSNVDEEYLVPTSIWVQFFP